MQRIPRDPIPPHPRSPARRPVVGRASLAWVLAALVAAALGGCEVVLGLQRAEPEATSGTGAQGTTDTSSTATSVGTTSATGSASAGTASSTGTGVSSSGSGGTTGAGGALTCATCWNHVWGDSDVQEALDVATDASGAMTYVVGRFRGTVQFDSTNALVAGMNSQNGFIVQLAGDGSIPLTPKAFSGGTGATQTLTAVAVDTNGDVIVGGYTDHFMTLDSKYTVTPGLFLAKLTSNLATLWVVSLGGSSGSSVNSVTVGPNNEVVACGAYLGTLKLPTGPVSANSGSNGLGTDAWLMVADSTTGQSTLGTTWGDSAAQTCRGVRADSGGNLFVAGSFDGQITITTGAALQSAGMNDVYLAKLGSDLSVQWQKQFGDANDQTCTGLAIDGTGRVAMTGQFGGMIDFDGTQYDAGSTLSLFVITYSDGGQVGWGHSFGSFGAPAEVHPAFDSTGNVALAGGFYGQISLGGVPVINPGASGHAIFAARLSPGGGQLSLQSWGDGSAEDSAHAVTMTPAGSPIVVGVINGTVDLGSGSVMTAGMGDAFVMKLGN